MSRLFSIRVAIVLFFVAGAVAAQDKHVALDKAFITVTNKADCDLSLSFVFKPAALPLNAPGSISTSAPSSTQTANKDALEIRRIVKPQQQITFSIPKGNYLVEANTAPQRNQDIIPQLPHPSNERENRILNNEVWTFELEKESLAVADDTSQLTDKLAMSHKWKRHIWPVRQPAPQKSAPAPPMKMRVVAPSVLPDAAKP